MNRSSLGEIEKKVEEELREGKTVKEISALIGICRDNVGKIKKQLIEKGIIGEEEIEQAKRQRNINDFLNDPITQNVLKYVREGLSQGDIGNLVQRAQGVISHKISLLIEYQVITQEEIDRARAQYLAEEKSDNLRNIDILEQLRRGISKAEIARKWELTSNGLKYIVDGLIAKGAITEDEIKEASKKYRKENHRRSVGKINFDDSKIDEKILEGVKKGYSQQQIVDKIFGSGNISQAYIGKRIKELIEKGIITQSQVDGYKEKARKEREDHKKEEKKQNRQKKKDEQKRTNKEGREIVIFLNAGYTYEQIAEKMGCSKSKVTKIVMKLRKEGRINQDKVDKARDERRRKERAKRKQDNEKLRKKQETEKIRQQKEEQAAKEQAAKEQANNEKKIARYNELLSEAKKIQELEVELSDEEINGIIRELINFAVTTLGRKTVKKEDITIIADTLFEAIQMDVMNVLGVAKLWVMIKDYQESIYILNYSKNFFEREEDLDKIEKAAEIVTIYRKKIQADKLFRAGKTLEEVARMTKLSVPELIRVKNRILQPENDVEEINIYPEGEEQE